MTTFRNLVEALQAAPGERPFVTYWTNENQQETVTFADFRRLARAQAGTLRENGVIMGDRVVIIMPQSIAAMAAFAGAMILGAVPAFVAYPNFKIDAAKYRSGLAGVTANLKARAVVIDQGLPDKLLDYVSLGAGAVLVRAESGKERNQEPDLPRLEVEPETIAFIQHSAGTTGLQKGVALTHAAVLRQIQLLSHALTLEPSDRIYSWLPLYHDMGLIACFMVPLACHVPVIMQSPVDWVMYPETMLQVISQHKCTLAWLPNFAFQFVPRRAAFDAGQYDLSSLRALINCSEPVRAESMREFEEAFAASGLRRGVLQSSYAMAENVFAVSQSDLARGPARIWADGQLFRSEHRVKSVPQQTPGAICFTSSGKLLRGHEIRIVSDSGSQLDDGSVGEILIRSDCLFDGYYNRPDLTRKVLEDDWYATGDFGFCRDGELYVIGRKKDLIIVCGENIYPHDIEEIVGAHPAIHDGRTIAMGLYDPELGTEEILVVAEVEREDLLANADEIERELRNRVSAAMGITVRLFFLKAPKWIVKSTAGKPARSATREKLFSEHPELALQTSE
ncbi:MAG TPA: AMP-binding protein [Terriglobales bacterium]|nr:AMP-binding protein [Terriglobales bacterium]